MFGFIGVIFILNIELLIFGVGKRRNVFIGPRVDSRVVISSSEEAAIIIRLFASHV